MPKEKTCLHISSQFQGKAPSTRTGMHIVFFVAVLLLFSDAMVHAREAWRFLPCFGTDVRGIERHAAEGHFFLALPARESDRENYAEELCPKKG